MTNLEFALTCANRAVDSVEESPYPYETASALVWLVTLDDLARAANKDVYRHERDTDPNGQVLDGLRLARNAVVHGAVATVSEQGLAYPLGGPGGALFYGPQVWVSLDELLSEWTPDGRKGVEAQKLAYVERVARQGVREPLVRALNWFDELRERDWTV